MDFNTIRNYNIYNNTEYSLKKEIRCIKKRIIYGLEKKHYISK